MGGGQGARELPRTEMGTGRLWLEQAESCERLSKYIHHLQPAPGHWRMLPMEVPACTGAWKPLVDAKTQKRPSSHLCGTILHFTMSYFPLMGLFFFSGIPKRIAAPSITAGQCQIVLTE